MRKSTRQTNSRIYEELSSSDEEVEQKYCICGQPASGFMIECSCALGKCNGWVHPSCCGFDVSPDQMNSISNYVCPSCHEFAVDNVRRKNGNPSTKLSVRPVVERFLGRRVIPGKADFEYLVKWKNVSYLHCSWESADSLDAITGVSSKRRIQRYQGKCDVNEMDVVSDEEFEEEYFNSDFVEVQRVVAECQCCDGSEHMFLVKWKSCSYSECTWELQNELRGYEDKISDLRQRCKLREAGEPLKSFAFTPLKKSPLYGEDNSLKLRTYQLTGVNWLLWNVSHERSSILADEMGLGKTVQTIAFLNELAKLKPKESAGPFLVVAPLSTLDMWQRTVDLWTPHLNCITYHGNAKARKTLRHYEFHFSNHEDVSNLYKFNVLVTSFEMVLSDSKYLGAIPWKVLVVDEAHRLKKHTSRLSEELGGFKRAHSLLLTGTPIQNNTEELWALMKFLDPKEFGDSKGWLLKFGELKSAEQISELHSLLKPYLLRRLKSDVEGSLPPKEETIVEVELTTVQKKCYRAIYERNTSFLLRGSKASNLRSLQNVMMELRKCCNHPYLNGIEEALTEDIPETATEAERFSRFISTSGKMVFIDKLLPKLRMGGHKVLIFSQMVRMLDLLAEYLSWRRYPFERLDGKIRGQERQAAIDRYSRNADSFVMLLSTRAGGLGINLTAADTVVIFDSDWNPQNDLQAQARAHRIGQRNSVNVYRLLTRNTYELHMFHRASMKLALDNALLHNFQVNETGGRQGLSATEVDELLRHGAYHVFKDDEDDTAASRFCQDDIDSILARNAKLVNYDQKPSNGAKSSFSKASFVSESSEMDVDVNDPDFWTKTIGLEAPPTEEDSAIINHQRSRKRTARYGDPNSESALSLELQLSSENEEEDTEAGEAYVSTVAKSKPRRQSGPRKWSANERDGVFRGLRTYGFGRWAAIKQLSQSARGLARRSFDELQSFSQALIWMCVECAVSVGNDADTLFRLPVVKEAFNDWLVPRPEGTPLPLSNEDLESRQNNFTDNDDKEDNDQVSECKLRAYAEEFNETPPAGAVRDCLEQQAFVSKLKGARHRSLRARASGAKTIQRLELLRLLRDTVGSAAKSIRFKRGEPLNDVPSDADELVDGIPIDVLAGAVSFAHPNEILERECKKLSNWMTPQHLQKILVGIFRHGWNKYECIREDGDLGFVSMNMISSKVAQEIKLRQTQALVKAETEGGSSELPIENDERQVWPESMPLNDLVRFSLGFASAEEEREQQTGCQWSSKEKRSLLQVVMLTGLPPKPDVKRKIPVGCITWEAIARQAEVLKSAGATKEYCLHQLLPHCEKIISVNLTDDKLGQSDNSVTSSSKKFIDPSRDPSTYGCHYIAQAEQLLGRFHLLDVIRKEVALHASLVEYLDSPLGSDVAGMPVWWDPPVHDLSLIRFFFSHFF
eukprot:TRINITY_DN1574_c0_g1_i4.p1 TRINITY_DN1574_c0_g1~~TRINITY_DN1574_c0_g1_i4.p1  ORF type:complete len:1418 (-),score=287.40 TRINITY_DN1574_c0_g1_i4:692-4945(-)